MLAFSDSRVSLLRFSLLHQPSFFSLFDTHRIHRDASFSQSRLSAFLFTFSSCFPSRDGWLRDRFQLLHYREISHFSSRLQVNMQPLPSSLHDTAIASHFSEYMNRQNILASLFSHRETVESFNRFLFFRHSFSEIFHCIFHFSLFSVSFFRYFHWWCLFSSSAFHTYFLLVLLRVSCREAWSSMPSRLHACSSLCSSVKLLLLQVREASRQ